MTGLISICIILKYGLTLIINVNHQFHPKNNVTHIRLLLLNNVIAILLQHDIIILRSLMYHNLKIVKFF